MVDTSFSTFLFLETSERLRLDVRADPFEEAISLGFR